MFREDKALQLYQAGAVSKSKISDDLYHVKSQKDPTTEYEVIPSMNVCTCMPGKDLVVVPVEIEIDSMLYNLIQTDILSHFDAGHGMQFQE